MKTIKGPGVFLAQFLSDEYPFNRLESLGDYMSNLGYKGVQLPIWDSRIIDIKLAAESQTYADDLKGMLRDKGLEITELSSHIIGQLVASHAAYDDFFDSFTIPQMRKNPKARMQWAIQQLKYAAQASRRLELQTSITFSGSLAWPFMFPWPQRPKGLIEMAFNELATRWKPILDEYDNNGIDLAFELHPGEDVFDGATFEMFVDYLGGHSRANINYDPSHLILQQLDYLQFIDIYHDRIKAFHVKDAEFNPSGRQGVYGGFANWADRAGRFRSPGDGQVRFKDIFSKLSQYDYDSWAVLEWECCIKSPEQGAREGVKFIQNHIIEVTHKAFDDFAGGEPDEERNKRSLGL
ncbi:Sugar phosphate isomerase/epimerase [Pseudarcicella hirudinis]|uniref:Sugar phosphate isomerase/epimerase n=1 Tax=Pseudarcicella hirudinis TaxID=1079859 RepID=A0A1I5YY00_9BACT|nr:sugar phosphate isomerase/epimerase [Pseudarcicella hirudinis]SFQ49082.1 Sugar phosphate isomerase/epimerase [Pseudarcicella hirudinis]